MTARKRIEGQAPTATKSAPDVAVPNRHGDTDRPMLEEPVPGLALSWVRGHPEWKGRA